MVRGDLWLSWPSPTEGGGLQPSGYFWVLGHQAHIPSFLGRWLYCSWTELGGTIISAKAGKSGVNGPASYPRTSLRLLHFPGALSSSRTLMLGDHQLCPCLTLKQALCVLWPSQRTGRTANLEPFSFFKALKFCSPPLHWFPRSASCDYHHGWKVWRMVVKACKNLNPEIIIPSEQTKTNIIWYHLGRFNPWVEKIFWRREWQPTPVFLAGESHGQRSLVGYSLWGHKESDMTEQVTLSLRCGI